MFGIIADLISSVTTILLPVYASYKALRTSDPAQLTPWLIYWVILSLLLLVESWTVFIIGWFPLYSWLRLIFLSYLVLPQTQGAKLLYYTYIEPFIVSHEHDIDVFIGETHKKLSAAGLGYLNTLIDLFVEQVLGRPPACKETHEAPSTAGYAQALFSRFAIPSARASVPAPADFYGMLSGAVAAATSATATFPGGSRSREMQAEPLSHRAGLYPESMSPTTASPTEKADYINAQREKLGVLMKALDREQQNLDLAYGDAPNLTERKNKSTHSFETVEHADAENESGTGHHGASHHSAKTAANRRTTSGNWIPSGWWPSASAGEGKAAGSPGWIAAQEITEAVQGMSSSVDPGR